MTFESNTIVADLVIDTNLFQGNTIFDTKQQQSTADTAKKADTLRAYSHQAKAGAEAKKTKQVKEIKE